MTESIDDLIKSHQGLVNDLRRYDLFSACRLIAGLLTLPQFHANTIRLEALTHLASVACQGKKEADREMLQRCATRHLAASPLARMEDPIEDDFVGNVATTNGNFRVFRGLQESGDFWLESALRPFELANVPTEAGKLFEQILPLLKLTEAVAEDSKCNRYTPGGGSPSHRLAMPSWRTMTRASSTVVFSPARLAQLGISTAELAPFILSDSKRQALNAEILGHTTLERFPLLQKGEDLLLALPPAITSCALRFLVEGLHDLGYLTNFGDIIYRQQADEWFNHFLQRLHFRLCDVRLPDPPRGLPVVAGCVMTFDLGKYAHCLFLDGNIRGHLSDSNAFDEFTTQQEQDFEHYLKDCAAAITQQKGFTGGMTLLTRGGLGRAFGLGLPELPGNWEIIFAGLPDWETIARCNEMSALRLWRMNRQHRWAESRGMMITNINGMLNLYGWWRRNGWRYFSHDMSVTQPPGLMMIGTDFLTDVRRDTRLAYDRHSCLAHDGTSWVRVEKKTGTSYFAENNNDPIYVVLSAVKANSLQGMVKTAARNWWVVTRIDTRNLEALSALYQLWDCFLNWTNKLAPIADEAFGTLPSGSIQFELNIQNIGEWISHNQPAASNLQASPFAEVDANARTIRITLPSEFAHEFRVPENRAERALVRCATSALSTLAGTEASEAFCSDVVSKVIPNEQARYFHVVYTENLANILTEGDKPEPDFIPEEDLAQSLIGLGEEIGNLPPKGAVIRGQPACLDYLQKAVDKLWERIEGLLRKFDRQSVIAACFPALAELEKDAEHWRMTARAQLALHRNQTDVLKAAEQRRSKQDAASLTTRILIETAMYVCPEQGSRPLPCAERLELLAHISNLISSANHRDAISRGFMPAEIRVFANGELDVDDAFYKSVMAPYVHAKSAKNFQDAAAGYESWFLARCEKKPNARIEDILSRLEQPFQDEYGLSLNQFLSVAGNFGRLAVETRKLILDFNETELNTFLVERCRITPSEAKAYIANFSLPPRSAWNKDLPSGLGDNDVYPWRFRRRLSLIMRPLVQVTSQPQKHWMAYPPLLVRSSVHLLYNLGEASFPTEHFHSETMRQFCGAQANLQGNQFNIEVGESIQNCGFSVRIQVPMSSLGVHSSEGDLGDVDVIAWRPNSNYVLAVECKNLRDAISVRDVVDRLDEYRGTRDDELGKHLRRVDWLAKNPKALSAISGIAAANLQIRSILVTSDLVPMQFFSGSPMPPKDVVAAHELRDYLLGGNIRGREIIRSR